jgi:hypothetical protein
MSFLWIAIVHPLKFLCQSHPTKTLRKLGADSKSYWKPKNGSLKMDDAMEAKTRLKQTLAELSHW